MPSWEFTLEPFKTARPFSPADLQIASELLTKTSFRQELPTTNVADPPGFNTLDTSFTTQFTSCA